MTEQTLTVRLDHNGTQADLYLDWDRLAKIADKFPDEIRDMRGLQGQDILATRHMLEVAGVPKAILTGPDCLPYIEGIKLLQNCWNLCMHGPAALKEPEAEEEASEEDADPENFQSDTF